MIAWDELTGRWSTDILLRRLAWWDKQHPGVTESKYRQALVAELDRRGVKS